MLFSIPFSNMSRVLRLGELNRRRFAAVARAVNRGATLRFSPRRDVASDEPSVRGPIDDPAVPRISAFYGIVIAMYYRDHAPPHFHAVYGEHEATIVISTLAVLAGDLPARALRLVQEWAALHQTELVANWDAARAHASLSSIEPLP
jgi:hypothetical protein